MKRLPLCLFFLLILSCSRNLYCQGNNPENYPALQKNQVLGDFRLANLYSSPTGRIVGIKLWHIPSGAPIFILRLETVPQAFLWVDTPDNSNKGLPHALEHLLSSKGTKGRYFALLKDMRLSRAEAATAEDFNYYGFASGSGMRGFFELFHALLGALYHPDFSDVEAEREFYHFGVADDPSTHKSLLVEQGTVYDEMLTGQGSFDYYFQLNKNVLGPENPFGFYSSGAPDEMRGVKPQEIRQFHADHYRLGPGTGFIFAIDPKENISRFLSNISNEFKSLPKRKAQAPLVSSNSNAPKYPIHQSARNEVVIYPFPGANASDPGEVRFSWPTVEIDSRVDLKLIDILFHCLGDGEQSLLYRALIDSKTRQVDLGATAVESEPFMSNSPHFPIWNLGVSGIPGNQLSTEKVERIRNLISGTIQRISSYPTDSKELQEFNRLALSYAVAARRVDRVWTMNAPDFGVRGGGYNWKTFLAALEMDPSFNRVISRGPMWDAVSRQLRSGKNIWHDLIQRFGLLSRPYAAAAAPSPQRLQELKGDQQDRIHNELQKLLQQYHTDDEQQALAQFDLSEQAKDQDISAIESSVPRPHFTEHPPLTNDDGLHYRRFTIAHQTPTVATIFKYPPTIDVGISFSLRSIPPAYYRYLPILPASFDRLGIKSGQRTITYPQLLQEIQARVYWLSVGYEFDALSKRADITFRCSGVDEQQVQNGIQLIQRMMGSSYLSIENLDRIRDIVDQDLSADDYFTKQGEEYWISNPAFSFLHQDDPLFFALNSRFTWNHWHWRLRWLLHKPVGSHEIDGLKEFAKSVLNGSTGESEQAFTARLQKVSSNALQSELLDYWRRVLSSIPDSERTEMLLRLAEEVQEDLRSGPERVVQDMQQLQRLVLNRNTLRVDLALSQHALDDVMPHLTSFVASIPSRRSSLKVPVMGPELGNPVTASLSKRLPIKDRQFPLHVGLVYPDAITGDVIFYAHAPGYSQIDSGSLVEGLARNLLSGLGPQSLHMKAAEEGLAYSSSVTNDPSEEFTWYYADRISDIPALLGVISSNAKKISELKDPFLVDYALRQSFATPRSMNTFSERGLAMAQDIWTGNTPEKVRRFSESLLALRSDPNLLLRLTLNGFGSICGVLLDKECEAQQAAAHSVFFFIGNETTLADAEKRLAIKELFRIWPSDYWIN